MRITIEDTAKENDPKYMVKVSVEVPYDDVSEEQVIEVFKQALCGYFGRKVEIGD